MHYFFKMCKKRKDNTLDCSVLLGYNGSTIDREYFKKGLAELVKRLSPKNIVVYGFAPKDIFAECQNSGINIIAFDCEHLQARKQVTV